MSENLINIINKNGAAVIKSEGLILTDVQSALDLIGDVSFRSGINKIVIFKESVAEDFFILSTGKLGEVLQKFVNYGVSLAIVGDFSTYKSKPFKDFIYESNKGKRIFFAANEQKAIEKSMEI